MANDDSRSQTARALPERDRPGTHGETLRLIAIKTARLSSRIAQYLQSRDFADQARTRAQAFTRRRKVGLVGVVSIILNLVRRTTQVELDAFLEHVQPGGEAMTYTKQSFAEALSD